MVSAASRFASRTTHGARSSGSTSCATTRSKTWGAGCLSPWHCWTTRAMGWSSHRSTAARRRARTPSRSGTSARTTTSPMRRAKRSPGRWPRAPGASSKPPSPADLAMIDLRLLREDPDAVKAAYERRGGVEGLDRVIELDARRRALLAEVERLRAQGNRASKAIGQASPEERPAAIEQAKELSDQIKAKEPELEALTAELEEAAAFLPNLPHKSVPDGLTEEENVVERTVGEHPQFDFEALDHVALGERLGIFDSERAARTSGSRFVYLIGPGVFLEMALVRFALDHLAPRGFKPVIPPVLVRERAMYGTGFLPAEEFEYYRAERDDLYLVGTSEVPLAALHADEILSASELPRRYVGYSPCFRRKAGSYGKETKGLIRVHQFDKVEQFSFCHPDDSWDEAGAHAQRHRVRGRSHDRGAPREPSEGRRFGGDPGGPEALHGFRLALPPVVRS